MEIIMRIHVKLLKKKTNAPLTGDEYSVQFYDKDILKDDCLGESSLDSNGHGRTVRLSMEAAFIKMFMWKKPVIFPYPEDCIAIWVHLLFESMSLVNTSPASYLRRCCPDNRCIWLRTTL